MESPAIVLEALRHLIDNPSLANARSLEDALRSTGYSSRILGRPNQMASIEAAGNSDRGIVERIANAFDASLTAARELAGARSQRELTPRVVAQRFLNPNLDHCDWEHSTIDKPVVEFWSDTSAPHLRYQKYHSGEGMVVALVRDASLGIARDEMPHTILELNSDSKLTTFETIGQFGHGGSSTFAFCESCLILTKPRFGPENNDFYWTLVFPELNSVDSKQPITRKWFCASDFLPLRDSVDAIPNVRQHFPGTSIWHFGYSREDWLKQIVGTHQDTPSARLGRMFFSFPLPIEIHGEFARKDNPTGRRTIKGAYYRLSEERDSDGDKVAYRSGEKSETLRIQGADYGKFSVFVFVLKPGSEVRNYVENTRPIILTLHGQNHGEMTKKILQDANYPEIASSTIVEIRLDGLEAEALNRIIRNSRDLPKTSEFTEALKARVTELLFEDEAMREIEMKRQLEKAQQSSEDLNKKMSKFLSAILSDAAAGPTEKVGGDQPGGKSKGGGGQPRPEIPPLDPPEILAFLSETTVFVEEGTARIVKFKSDARRPKYSFFGDNPRCFTRLLGANTRMPLLRITGQADIDDRGYGSVTLACDDCKETPIREEESVGELEVAIQTTDGRTMTARVAVGIAPRPVERHRKRKPSIRPEIIFCAPDDADKDVLKGLFYEKSICPLTASLKDYCEKLAVPAAQGAYWGAKSERAGENLLVVEINAGHPDIVKLLKSISTVEDRVKVKDRIAEDIVLDCYQHWYRLDDMPAIVHEQLETAPDDLGRCSEICLNFDKAIRLAARGKSPD